MTPGNTLARPDFEMGIKRRAEHEANEEFSMNVLVVGVDHEIQMMDAWRTEETKAAYRELLTGKIHQYGIQFIGEEAPSGRQTVGEHLTVEMALPYPWKNIDMLEEARKEAGIYAEQMNRVPVECAGKVETHYDACGFYLDLKNGSHLFCPRVPSDLIREEYMFERALEGACNADSIMVLCGNFHLRNWRGDLGLGATT